MKFPIGSKVMTPYGEFEIVAHKTVDTLSRYTCYQKWFDGHSAEHLHPEENYAFSMYKNQLWNFNEHELTLVEPSFDLTSPEQKVEMVIAGVETSTTVKGLVQLLYMLGESSGDTFNEELYDTLKEVLEVDEFNVINLTQDGVIVYKHNTVHHLDNNTDGYFVLQKEKQRKKTLLTALTEQKEDIERQIKELDV